MRLRLWSADMRGKLNSFVQRNDIMKQSFRKNGTERYRGRQLCQNRPNVKHHEKDCMEL